MTDTAVTPLALVKRDRMVARVVVMAAAKVEPMVMAAVKVETVAWAGQDCPSGYACWHVFGHACVSGNVCVNVDGFWRVRCHDACAASCGDDVSGGVCDGSGCVSGWLIHHQYMMNRSRSTTRLQRGAPTACLSWPGVQAHQHALDRQLGPSFCEGPLSFSPFLQPRVGGECAPCSRSWDIHG